MVGESQDKLHGEITKLIVEQDQGLSQEEAEILKNRSPKRCLLKESTVSSGLLFSLAMLTLNVSDHVPVLWINQVTKMAKQTDYTFSCIPGLRHPTGRKIPSVWIEREHLTDRGDGQNLDSSHG